MNLRQLKYFLEAAQTQNIAKAAKKYMVPASAVSIAIKHLEQELGFVLFERASNKIRLTEKGRHYAQQLGQAFSAMQAVTQQLSENREPAPKIKVLIRARPKWITELITQFKEQNSDIGFIISNDYTITDISEFDVVIDEDAKQYKHLARFLLSTEIICIKASANSNLTQKTLTFCDLKYEPFILPSAGNGMRNLYERTCQKHGIVPNVAIECNDRQCLQHYVQADMGLTLGAYRALEDNTQNNISALKVTDFNEVQSVYVFYREDYHGAAKVFCDFLYAKRYL